MVNRIERIGKKLSGNRKIWRYMNLDKFLDMIINKHLYFTNIANLTDQNEGILPIKTIQSKRRSLVKEGLRRRDLEEEIEIFTYQHNILRNGSLVNCWSLGKTESYALWKIYLKGSKSGVAIQSTVGSLIKSINIGKEPYQETIFMGKVKYTDYLNPAKLGHRLNLVTWKNHFYSNEKEIRLCIFRVPRSEGGDIPPYNISIGRHYKIDLTKLIHKIYISPFTDKWFEDTLISLVNKISPTLSKNLVKSEVRDE